MLSSLEPEAAGRERASRGRWFLCTTLVHDDGTGEALYAGGEFKHASGTIAKRVARWDGSSWSGLGGGTNTRVLALSTYDDGTGSSLVAGGNFLTAFDAQDSFLARWTCSAGATVSYCTAGTSASGCQAALSAAGTPSATALSGFSLQATGVEGAKDGLFFVGTNGRQANSWGSGTSYQCVVPPVIRCGLLTATGTPTLCDGAFSQDLNALWTANPAKNPGAGAVVQAQLWYRDPLNTSNQTTSMSDAVEFTVSP